MRTTDYCTETQRYTPKSGTEDYGKVTDQILNRRLIRCVSSTGGEVSSKSCSVHLGDCSDVIAAPFEPG